jgi:hypothetical protein
LITTYQIRNVLRIYGNQLKKRTMLLQESSAPSGRTPDSVNISVEARRKQMYDQISSNIVSQITRNNPEAKSEENFPEVNSR